MTNAPDVTTRFFLSAIDEGNYYFGDDDDEAQPAGFTAEIIQRLRSFDINISNNPKVAGKDINDVLAPMGLTREKMSIDGIKAWGWKGITPNNVQPARNHSF